MLKSIWFLCYYLILIITVIVCQLYFPNYLAHSISKSFLMLSLALAFLTDTMGISSGLKWTAFFALLLSLAGDILLLPDIDLFLPGLLSFLAAHIMYIICFLKVEHIPLSVTFIRKHPWSIFLMILYGGWIFLRLRIGAGEMAWAVLIYILCISVMTLTAFNRQGAVSGASYRSVAFGALLFIASDSILAWNRFLSPIEYSAIWIIGTYALAQLLIVTGLSLQVSESEKGV